ncbi:MAG TPA: permease [Firmicutes bacterium]|nr:permease [Bacillota bacterium]
MWQSFVNWLTYSVLRLSPDTRFGSAVNFFIYDTVKVLFLLAVIIFFVAIIRSFFPPEKTKKILARGNEYVGNVLAALLGIVTPFCSCSAVPLFIGFVESGVPLGVTFSFLISSPMVNEVALILLWGLFGWKIALLYIASGVTVAIVAGIIIGRLHLEKWVEDYVWQIQVGSAEVPNPTWRERLAYARGYVKEIVGRVWLYVIFGIGVGAFIHGYAPANFLLRVAGKGNPLAVPVAVLIGVPLYSNAAGTIPIVKALIEKGMAMGTALAFMMAVTALSLPEGIILRKVLKPKLLAIYFGIGTLTIIATGYLFNWVL